MVSNGHMLKIYQIGDAFIDIIHCQMIIKNVILVLELNKKLLSMS